MGKLKKIASIAFTGTAAAAAAGFPAVPAVGARSPGTWRVSPGGAYSALNQSGPTLWTQGTVFLNCATSTAYAWGSLAGAATGAPAELGTIDATFGASGVPCTLMTIQFSAYLNHAAQLWGSTYSNGVTHGTIPSVSATVNGLNLICHARITGSLPVSFDNATHVLAVNAAQADTLRVQSVVGCLGGIFYSGPAMFTANYHTLSPSGLTVTGP